MRFKDKLLQIIEIFFIITCFDEPNVLCDEEGILKETDVVKLIDKCGDWDERSPAPWSVTVTEKLRNKNFYKYLCEGSIVTPNVIITAAQCYTDIVGKVLKDQNDMYIVAGKHNSDFEEDKFAESTHAQVKELHIAPEYRSLLRNFAGNLAVIVLRSPIEITNVVQPVCFDRNNKIESQHLLHNNHETERWNVDQYQYIGVNATDMIDLNKCFKKFPTNHNDAITAFKSLCPTITGGPAFCRNRGGGMILNNKKQFYIRGVIGFSPTIKRRGCDPDLHVGVFTNISDYHQFILTIIDDHEMKIGDCPGLAIDNGKIEQVGQRQSYSPGAPVRNYELVKFNCDNNYALRPTNPFVTCVDGNFTNSIPQCKRILRGAASEVINVIDECGYWDEKPPAPWNVAVYHKEGNDKYEFLCGGSIITANVIITAATCMTDEEKFPAEELYVATGKYYYDYNNAEDDELVQKSQVKEYHIPPEFKANPFKNDSEHQDFQGDLAVIVLQHPFLLTHLVQPVCLDRNNKIEQRQVTPNNTGIVTGWDVFSSNGLNELKQSNSTYINNERCMDTFKSSRYIEQLTSDKFCADYITCGVAGGGLAYKWDTNSKQQFYIRGLNAAVNAEEYFCGDIGIFTNITFHKNFILKIIDHQLSINACPSITIENGQFSVVGQDYTPKDFIPNYNVVNLTCNANYTLHPANPLISCNDGDWSVRIPQCKLTCPPIISRSADVMCTVDGNPVDCSLSLVEGAVARSKCKLFYKLSDYDIQISTCTGGSWSNPVIRCEPECGEVISKGVTNIVNGKSAKIGNFPWHIALYRLVGEKHKYQCGGSIITSLIIITAAHCFTDDGVLRVPADNFYIGAGKYYSDYYSADDKQAQKRQVKKYHIPTEYRGYESHYAGDLAVVVVQRAFRMTNVVQPVCMDWIGSMEKEQLKHNNNGSVVGWGYTDPETPKESAELKQLKLPFIGQEQCLNKVPENFRRWVTPDKFCAGFTNGTSVCKGDSGGGLVFKGNNTGRYFIRGVVSVGPLRDGETDICDEFQYGVYTKISHYKDFIQDIIITNPVKN